MMRVAHAAGAGVVVLLLCTLILCPVGARKARKERKHPSSVGKSDAHAAAQEHALASAALAEWVRGMISTNGTSPEVLRAAMRQIVDEAPNTATAAAAAAAAASGSARAYGLPFHAHGKQEDVSAVVPSVHFEQCPRRDFADSLDTQLGHYALG
jgi:hypothetical protein